jgi:hypothetical protein
MKVWKFLWGQKGRKPSVNQLDHETIAKDKETGTLYLLTESSGGAKAVIEINGSAPGASDAHLRAHQIDSVDDHPAVAEDKRDKWLHTNAETGAIELVDLPDLGNNLDIFAADDPYFPILQHLYKKEGEADAELVTVMQKPQSLVWGGIVTWVEEMNFSVSRAIYYIIGDAYSAPDSILTISAADELLNRIDLVVANNDNTFSIVTGEPGTNPVKPGINPLTQIEITQINVPAGTTNFGGIVEQVIIYNENIEWVGTGNGVTVNFNSATNPYHGLKCADVGSIGANDTITFVGASVLEVADYEVFSMFLKLKATLAKNESISIQFMLGSTAVSAEKLLDFNKSVIDTWQNVTFKFADIFFSSFTFDGIKFIYRRPSGDHAGFYLDYIKIEAGVTQPIIVSSIILQGDIIGTGVTGTPVQTTLKTVTEGGTFGSATKIPVVTVDAKGRVTSVTEEDVEGGGGEDGLTPFIGENGNWWIGETDTGVKAAGTDGEDGDDGLTPVIGENGNWFIGGVDTGVNATGDDGAQGSPGSDGENAYLYIAYASDDAGTDFSLSPGATLIYIAFLNTDTEIPTPVVGDFTGLWVKYIGEEGEPGDIYDHWKFNVETTTGLVETPIHSGEKVHFKPGDGIEFERTSHETLGHVIEIKATGGGGGGSTQLTAIPATDQTASGITTQFTANEAQAFGDVVRINSAGKAQVAKADIIENANVLAICIANVLANAIGSYLLIGFIRDDSWNWTIGSKVYLSLTGTTGNTLTQTNPADIPCSENNVIQILGIANSADSIYFSPSLSQVEYKA